MCTVTLVRSASGYTLTMNRDERRSRAEAGLHQNKQLCYPVDAAAGGTWVGVNNNGIALAVLNRYQSPTIEHAVSRGNIIPQALALGNETAILSYLESLSVDQYNPFDCLVVSLLGTWHFSWDRPSSYRKQLLGTKPAYMLTSSSERLEEVTAYRNEKFTAWQKGIATEQTVDHFHLEQDTDFNRSAVLMSREQTHTKSLTQIKVSETYSQLHYYPQETLAANSRLVNLTSGQFCRLTNKRYIPTDVQQQVAC